MEKKYISTVTVRTARPRSSRLRELGSTVVSSSTVVSEGTSDGGGDGHTHVNKEDLDRLRVSDDGYVEILTPQADEDGNIGQTLQKAKAGQSDTAKEAEHAADADDAGKWNGEQFAEWLDQAVRKIDPVEFLEVVSQAFRTKTYSKGISGASVDTDGNAEMGSLTLRDALIVPELRYNRTEVVKGYVVISSGGGCKVSGVASLEDGNWTITPDLLDGEALSQEVDDILMGYWYDGSTDGEMRGFGKMLFRVVSVDADARTFVASARPGSGSVPHANMVLAQVGNFSNTDRQTCIAADSRNGDNNITFYDSRNTWDVSEAQEKAWIGKKTGRNIQGIPCDNYSGALQNVILTGKIFQVDSITDTPVLVPIDKGRWVTGQTYAYYDRVSWSGSLWLCIAETTTVEPSTDSPDWSMQVDGGMTVVDDGEWDADKTPYEKGSVVKFLGSIFCSVRRTSEPPYPLWKIDDDTYGLREDGTYALVDGEVVNEDDWSLLIKKPADGEDAVAYKFESLTSSIKLTGIGTPDPASFTVNLKKTAGDVTADCADLWISARKYVDGAYLSYQEAQQTSAYALSVPAGATRIAIRAYATRSEAEAWMESGILASYSVAMISDGVGINSIAEYYAVSPSNSVIPDAASFSSAMPSMSASDKYLWNYAVISYSDGTTAGSASAAVVIGTYGDIGVGISGITEHYAISSSNSEAPTTWLTSPPVVTTEQPYLWFYDTVNYTNGTVQDTAPRIIGTHGATGDPGTQGPVGPMPRDKGVWKSEGEVYVYNDDYRDKIIYAFDGVYYNFLVKTKGTTVYDAPTSATGDDNWEAMQAFVNLATDTIFADNAKLGDFVFVSHIFRSAETSEDASRTWIDGSHDIPNLYMNSLTGQFHCNDADITGLINATSGTIGGFLIDSGRIGKAYDGSSSSVSGLSLYDSFIRFSDGTERHAIIGSQVFSALMGINAVCHFANTTVDASGSNYALYVNSENALINYAMYGSGDIVINGNVAAYKYRHIIATANGVIPAYPNVILFTFNADVTYVLPPLGYLRIYLGISDTSVKFSYKMTIITSIDGSTHGGLQGGSSAASVYPVIINNDGSIADGRLIIDGGDVYEFELVWDGSNYRAYILNYRS